MSWILALPFAVIAAYAVYAAFKYTRMISNIFLGLVYRPSADAQSPARGEALTVLDSSDREIQMLHLECAGSKKLLIFCHESGSSKESWEKYAYFFPALGYHVLSVDFPEKPQTRDGNSLAQWPRETEVETLLTVIRWAKRALSSRLSVVLFGVSKGADLALAASFRDSSVRAVIADGLFSMKEIFRDYIRRWGPILVKPNLFGEHYPDWVVNIFTSLGLWHSQCRTRERFVDVEALLKKKHAPLFMIHGENDDYVPASHQKFLEKIEERQSSGRLVALSAGHNQAVTSERALYENGIKSFLEKALR